MSKIKVTVSPDLAAYASGQLDISKVRCALCTKAPCQCQYCPATNENKYHMISGRPQFEECGMRIDPNTGKCPRGHKK